MSLKCKLGIHKWIVIGNYSITGLIFKCERCDKEKRESDPYC